MFARLNLSAQSSYLAQWAQMNNHNTKLFSKKYTHAGRIVYGLRDTMETFYGRGGGGLRTRVKEVRESEVMWLLGNKANPHNRMKKNWLCGLMLC